MDEDGFIFFVDRDKDLIVSSGYNVALAEVGSILMGHPTVNEAAVIGSPDDYKGEVVIGFISITDAFKAKNIIDKGDLR